MIFSLFLVSLMVIVGCSQENPTEGLSEDEQILESQSNTGLAGQAVYSGDYGDLQYMFHSGGFYKDNGYGCQVYPDQNCRLDSATGKIKRDYLWNGKLQTGTYTDQCYTYQTSSGSEVRSRDYGCIGDDFFWCWKKCASTCSGQDIVCTGDVEVESCTAVDATACTAGVSCPGNFPVAALGCPSGQACNAAGSCVNLCGNGVVDAGETCETCPADAGACPVALTEFVCFEEDSPLHENGMSEGTRFVVNGITYEFVESLWDPGLIEWLNVDTGETIEEGRQIVLPGDVASRGYQSWFRLVVNGVIYMFTNSTQRGGFDHYKIQPLCTLCGNGVVDAGETCETCAADVGACPVETEFCAKYTQTWPFAMSDICEGDTKLASNVCNDYAAASECCQIPSGTVFTNSCDGRFVVNTTTTAQCGGVSEKRSVKTDCTEVPLVNTQGVSTCATVVSYSGLTPAPVCAQCGFSKCRSPYGYEYFAQSCRTTGGVPDELLEIVTGDGCDLTTSCTGETDGGNVPGTAGSLTMTLSDGRSNILSDNCYAPRSGKEYYCASTSQFGTAGFSCTTAQNCLEGTCVTPTSCTDDGLVNDKAVLNSVTLQVNGENKVVNDHCASYSTAYVYQVSCSGDLKTYVEADVPCDSGKTCNNGVCS